MPTKFIKDQIVQLTDENKSKLEKIVGTPLPYYVTFQKLCSRDIRRGFISVTEEDWGKQWSTPLTLDLSLYEVVDDMFGIYLGTPLLHQSLRGKFVQPIADVPRSAMNHCINTVCSVEYRGSDIMVDGLYNPNTGMFYFIGIDSQWYKSKTFVNSTGHVQGFFTNVMGSPRKVARLHKVKV